MTYLELFKLLLQMKPEHLSQTVTVQTAEDEFISIDAVKYTDDACDVLDNDHLYLGTDRRIRNLVKNHGRTKAREIMHFKNRHIKYPQVDEPLKCGECDSTNIEEQVWVTPNHPLVDAMIQEMFVTVDTGGNCTIYCCECSEMVDLSDPDKVGV
tara:strand:+ start:6965 stop:7426 length:462 start_codon:yes stop_codon:yes gene_type:complete